MGMGGDCSCQPPSPKAVRAVDTKACKDATVYDRLVFIRCNLLELRDTINRLGMKLHEGQEMPETPDYNRYPNLSLIDMVVDMGGLSEELMCKLRDFVQII